MIDSYDGKTINYKLVGSEEEINKKAAAAMTLINNETAEAIKNAKKEAASMIRLSSMTLPHAMARVLLVEQLYRAWTILQGHPYHRV